MSIFGIIRKGFGKAEDKSSSVAESMSPELNIKAVTEITKIDIKILGGGCPRCNTLEKNTVEALEELGLNYTLEHIKDYDKIASMGVMSTPALMVDQRLVSCGKVLTKQEVIAALNKGKA